MAAASQPRPARHLTGGREVGSGAATAAAGQVFRDARSPSQRRYENPTDLRLLQASWTGRPFPRVRRACATRKVGLPRVGCQSLRAHHRAGAVDGATEFRRVDLIGRLRRREHNKSGETMDEQTLNRRQILGGMAAAGATGLLGGAAAREAVAADAAPPAAAPGAAPRASTDVGPAQAPPITDVKGKVAYITGGSSGIGLGIARVFHEAGMKVVIGYLDEQHIGDALKHFPDKDPRVHAIKHDVMDRDAWPRVADEIDKKFGGVQILVNNAGVGLQAPASTGTYKDWEWGLGVNLWGPIYGVHTYVPRMLASKQGAHIVTTTSTSGILPGSGAGVYTVSKI